MPGSFRTKTAGLTTWFFYAPEPADGTEVGKVGLSFHQRGSVALIEQLEVTPKHRGHGLARALLADLEALLLAGGTGDASSAYPKLRELRLVALEDVLIGSGKLEAMYLLRGAYLGTQSHNLPMVWA